ncbi:MAG: glycosyltransferase [Armatimonadetes bacterium]|nr:glycosyltransferase [Armatimonadota bacterium]
MRVALWTSWETRCGIASYASSLARELEKLGVTVEVVRVPYTSRDAAAREADLERLNSADLVHLQHEYTFFGGVAPGASSLPQWLRRLRVPHVVTAHTVFTARELLRVEQESRPRQRIAKQLLAALPGYRRSVEREPFARARAWIVHTQAARARFASFGFPADRIAVLPAGIPSPCSEGGDPEALEDFRQRHRLGPGKVAAVFGYVTPDKGYELVLAALRALPIPLQLLVAGGTRVEHEAAYLARLEAEAARQGLHDRVRVTGFLDDAGIHSAMALADLVLVPHTAANGSYSVMVALGHRRPVLASDLPCFRDLQQQWGCVELFRAGDAVALQERMAFLLASAGARDRLIGAASRFAEERSWAAVARQTLAVYEEVLR